MDNTAPRTAQKVWRYVLHEMATPDAKARAAAANLRTPTRRGSMIRTAEKCVSLLYQVVRHLHERYPKRIPPVLPMKKWKRELRKEWRQELGIIHKVSKPRHSEQETSNLIVALPRAEPRLAVMLDTGMELRGGQVRRAMRSALDLGRVGAYGLGRLTIHGTETKPGETVDLHPEMRERIDYAVTEGYLRELEAAFQERKIDDYHLFPGNRMSQGVVRLDSYLARPRAVSKRSALGWFHDLERIAGVEHVEGRSFYGLRRVLTDVARNYTDDDRALDRLTGHIDPTTRIKEYQDRQRDEDRALAAEVRRRYRLDLAGETGNLSLADRILGRPQLVRFLSGVIGAAIETGQTTLELGPVKAALKEVLSTSSEAA